VASLDRLCYGLTVLERAYRGRWKHTQAGMTMKEERWLSVDEIAAHLGVNPDTVYKWIERKKLPAHKVGRLWKFQVSEVNEWVRAGKVAEEK
jgi:excisionase family DNA binding protein